MNHLRNQRRARVVDIPHKLAQALLREEHLFLIKRSLHRGRKRIACACRHRRALRQHHPLVRQRDFHTRVQVCQLAHTVRQDVVLIHRLGEYRPVGPELHTGARTHFVGIVGPYLMHRAGRLAFRVLLHEYLPVAAHLHMQFRRERIHAAHAHAVQTARHLIGVLVELTARVQHSHHHLQRTLVLLRVHVHRDTATVVLHRDRVIFVYRNFYMVAEAGQRLVYRVIHHLINQVVQTLLRDVANVHRRTLPHCLQAFEHLNTRTIILLLSFHFRIDYFFHNLLSFYFSVCCRKFCAKVQKKIDIRNRGTHIFEENRSTRLKTALKRKTIFNPHQNQAPHAPQTPQIPLSSTLPFRFRSAAIIVQISQKSQLHPHPSTAFLHPKSP